MVALSPVMRKTSSGLVANVAPGIDRIVSLMATVFDMPSVKFAWLTLEFS